jgi:wyosine [tRNA(Phe)-imidazoG37] synthetase (radical SAM superfamily)
MVVRVPEVGLKVKAEESMRAPPVVANGMRPEVRDEIARFVVVAWEVVAFNAVKFWRVVEPVWRRLAIVTRPAVAFRVPVKFAAEDMV